MSHITVYVKPKNTKITREELEERRNALKESKAAEAIIKSEAKTVPKANQTHENKTEGDKDDKEQKKSWWSWSQ